MRQKIHHLTPVPKPRMTRRDRWAKRPCVLRYFAFRDKVKELGIEIPEGGGHVLFYMPMPKSWSNKKKCKMDTMAHQQKPDIDNLIKGLLDAVYKEDSVVHDIRATKRWAKVGGIGVRL
jgi:Holliday junction resolvase RusA-like endonuclease